MNWQPMETAPKDGRKILAVLANGDGVYFYEIVSWDDDLNEFVDRECMGGVYDAWAELEPPTDTIPVYKQTDD
jgi:hypothetical protein